MASFTMPLKEVIATIYSPTDDPDDFEQTYDSVTFDGITYGKLPILEAPEKIGLGTYPIFDEGYRKVLNGKIIDEYFNREIGTESIDDFMLIIRRKLDQIMPFYNKLYKSEQIDYDALMTMDIHSVSSSTLDGQENVASNVAVNSETKTGARVISSSTPQTMLIPNADYATGGTDTNSDTDTTSGTDVNTETSNTNNTSSDNRVTGFQGNASQLVMQYRASLLNIDTLILSDIEDCFMMVLSTGDSFTNNRYYY